jgi:co-chaperonin GroES (HSP10)
MSDDWLFYTEHNGVYGEVVQWDAVFGGKAIQFSSDVTIHAPHAEIGRKDRTVIVRVICVGPGNVSRGQLNPCTIKSGDYVVANLFHRSHEPCILGEYHSLFPWENIMAKLMVDEVAKSMGLDPLQAYIICKPNEAVAQRLMMGERKIIAPFGDAQFSGSADEPMPLPGRKDRAPERSKTVIEEVVSVGPGAVVDGVWQEPPQSLVGGMVMYDTSVAPVRFVALGEQYTLVHWRHVLFSFRKRPEIAPSEASAAVH